MSVAPSHYFRSVALLLYLQPISSSPVFGPVVEAGAYKSPLPSDLYFLNQLLKQLDIGLFSESPLVFFCVIFCDREALPVVVIDKVFICPVVISRIP
jgi:hypothetical protein